MNKTIAFLVSSFVLSSVASADPMLECSNIYQRKSSVKKLESNAGTALESGGGSLAILGGTTAGMGAIATAPIAVGGSVLGSSAVAGSGYGLTLNGPEALFASVMAQMIGESEAKVIGPVTIQASTDLNDAIYINGAQLANTGDSNSPLPNDLRFELMKMLGGNRLSANQVQAANLALFASGRLCGPQGQTLNQKQWAKAVVFNVVQTAKL